MEQIQSSDIRLDPSEELTLKLLFESGQAGRGRMLDGGAIRTICNMIAGLLTANRQMLGVIKGLEYYLDCYTAEYGEELLESLVEENVVYGEVISDGRDDEELRVDTQVEEDEASLPETGE